MKLGSSTSQSSKQGGLLGVVQVIQKSSLARVVIMSVVKIINGAFFVTHPCDSFQTQCYYGFLRGVITTVDYQLYYMDYLLVEFQKQRAITSKEQNCSAFESQTNPNILKTSIKQSHIA